MTKAKESEVADEVVSLVARCLEKVTQANMAVAHEVGDPPARLFFPSGIELIYVKFQIGRTADVTFALAGPNAKYPKDPAMSENPAIVADRSGNPVIKTT